ncbi:bifunctional 3-(3-hydroxy-phenyl)propionate/3-hydroxycinnamic acid hydroxylase [Sphingomonas sp. MG17]|uniref:Bifunctional 3-(3-hydroxy-phenyl)propionate/3-hydroxycinnamic acid hydroxylase n=1 Tax=Sphingomonas tagetis TaxID=2949092 RepID=A0A9X2KJZ7_9SPHN|nr:bifunctional 3-(3-hydroxy-phenyl)propionate/3-hydroxycinnamic acid hydroxylase [Sphingomonas tagetis]MCP3729999.1 bifunctional 3-(3-hydroxy-phenyl)propionate/3-hydroxycinnamic acid hydroxylase [Sphingomonas tagetis]
MIDVAIIGAGPVGLFTALLLQQRGVSVALYERWPTFYPLPRACGVDHEIVRQLQGAGLAEAMEPLLDPVIGPDKTYEFFDAKGETILQIDWNRPGLSGFAQMNMFYQPDLERMLAEQLEASPLVSIHRGRELVSIEQHDGHVALEFAATEDLADRITVEARYAIGADGARATTRNLLGIAETDLGFGYDWLVLDVVPHEKRVWKPYVIQHCDPARPHTLVGSGPTRRRWEFMRLPGETIEQLNSPEMAWQLLARWDLHPGNATLERHTVYTFRGAWADEWKKGRVMLAGDAAHLMPPFLGQGLCSGMRDAMALGWRLAAVLKGEAPEALFDSYGPERSGHVQEIITQAVEMGRIICMLDPAEVAARDAHMKAAIKDPALALKPPPEPRLGESGGYRTDDPNAGYLSVQGRVGHGGREGLFDDVIGTGWQLLLRNGSAVLDQRACEGVARLGGVIADFGPDGGVTDLDGTYAAWFERLGAEAVLVRPDFYVFGTGSITDAAALVADARAMLGTEAVELRR